MFLKIYPILIGVLLLNFCSSLTLVSNINHLVDFEFTTKSDSVRVYVYRNYGTNKIPPLRFNLLSSQTNVTLNCTYLPISMEFKNQPSGLKRLVVSLISVSDQKDIAHIGIVIYDGQSFISHDITHIRVGFKYHTFILQPQKNYTIQFSKKTKQTEVLELILTDMNLTPISRPQIFSSGQKVVTFNYSNQNRYQIFVVIKNIQFINFPWTIITYSPQYTLTANQINNNKKCQNQDEIYINYQCIKCSNLSNTRTNYIRQTKQACWCQDNYVWQPKNNYCTNIYSKFEENCPEEKRRNRETCVSATKLLPSTSSFARSKLTITSRKFFNYPNKQNGKIVAGVYLGTPYSYIWGTSTAISLTSTTQYLLFKFPEDKQYYLQFNYAFLYQDKSMMPKFFAEIGSIQVYGSTKSLKYFGHIRKALNTRKSPTQTYLGFRCLDASSIKVILGQINIFSF